MSYREGWREKQTNHPLTPTPRFYTPNPISPTTLLSTSKQYSRDPRSPLYTSRAGVEDCRNISTGQIQEGVWKLGDGGYDRTYRDTDILDMSLTQILSPNSIKLAN